MNRVTNMVVQAVAWLVQLIGIVVVFVATSDAISPSVDSGGIDFDLSNIRPILLGVGIVIAFAAFPIAKRIKFQ